MPFDWVDRAVKTTAVRSHRPQQDVSLPAERKLDDALRREVARCEHHLLVRNRDVVDPQTTTLDLPACLTLRRHQADVKRSIEHAESGFELPARNFDGRQRFGKDRKSVV